MSGPTPPRNDSQLSNGGPAHDRHESQEIHGGPAQIEHDGHNRYGGPAQGENDNHPGDGGPAQKSYGSQPGCGGPAHSWHDSHDGYGGPAHGSYDGQSLHGGPAEWNSQLLADLRAAGEDLADLIEVRKAAENRARTLGHLDTEQVRPEWITTAERAARQALQDMYVQAVPLHVREWAKTVPGLATGELFPRMIAIIGDPCWAVPLLPIAKGDTGLGARSQPAGPAYLRSPHQLWQWCGLGDPRSKAREDYLGRKPEQADMLHAGKRSQLPPLLYVWTTQLVKGKRHPAVAESRYWKILTERKAEGASKVHEFQCQNHQRPPRHPDGCGTSLHPEWGAPGSSWRKGHINMDAHRVTQKALLMDLWRAAQNGRPNPETAVRRERRRRAR